MNKIASFIKLWRSSLRSSASKISNLSAFFTMFAFIMPLLLGISVGWFGTIFVDYIFSSKGSVLQLSMAANMATAQSRVVPDNGLVDFLSANPFLISAFTTPASNVPVTETPKEEKADVRNSFAAATLTWTFPNVGAWMQDNTNNKQDFISIGESFEAHKLAEVLYDRAIFQDEDNNNVIKYFYLVGTGTGAKTKNISSLPAPLPQPTANQNQIIAAVFGGAEGVISRNIINELLMNPFEEMRKFRIRPKFEENEPVGIEAQWIQNDSILGSLGIIKGDMLKSINGIPMKNMGDITNAINSLMNGTRFDVEIQRGNITNMLRYVVR